LIASQTVTFTGGLYGPEGGEALLAPLAGGGAGLAIDLRFVCEIEDYRMAHRFLCGRYPLVEIGVRIESAMVAAEGLVKTPWARARVPVIARALDERSVLSGDDVYALFA
jgi:hypothetical protein